MRSRRLVAAAHEGTSLMTLTALETSDFTRNVVTTEGRIKRRAAFAWFRSLVGQLAKEKVGQVTYNLPTSHV